ncbi:envelope stress response membrane protein PspC [Aliikangiella maris]|uniref:Envelope stress response membrane protein PspC n=2 Tax=Aliikangiella maris TaxID=3162458 RepID=A0ABV2BRY2_9GAMM
MGENKRKLYKNPDKAKIFGVCAGIAEYFGFEVWVVRIITLALAVLNWFNGTIVFAYLVLFFVLDPKPESISNKGCFGKERHRARPDKTPFENKPYKPTVKDVWRSGSSPKEMLDTIEYKFSTVESKLQRLESFITSKQFELEREFNKMN